MTKTFPGYQQFRSIEGFADMKQNIFVDKAKSFFIKTEDDAKLFLKVVEFFFLSAIDFRQVGVFERNFSSFALSEKHETFPSSFAFTLFSACLLLLRPLLEAIFSPSAFLPPLTFHFHIIQISSIYSEAKKFSLRRRWGTKDSFVRGWQESFITRTWW